MTEIISLSMKNNKWGWATPGPYGVDETFDLIGIFNWITDSYHLTDGPSYYSQTFSHFENGKIVIHDYTSWHSIEDYDDDCDDWDVDWRER